MTVQELRDALSEFDPDAIVQIDGMGDLYNEVADVAESHEPDGSVVVWLYR